MLPLGIYRFIIFTTTKRSFDRFLPGFLPKYISLCTPLFKGTVEDNSVWNTLKGREEHTPNFTRVEFDRHLTESIREGKSSVPCGDS